MKYCLAFYDNFYHTYKRAYDLTLFDLLHNFGFWIDTSDEWYIYKLCGSKITMIGRSSEVK